jgi:uncharacterized GH25 family protein
MKKTFLALAAFAAVSMPLAAHAHRQWIEPSSTVLSGTGDDVWVTFDAAVSNTLFHADHQPMRIDNLVVTAPDGSTIAPQNVTRGRYRSTFDVQLTQNGTYRIVNASAGMNARYELNGENRNWRGAASEFATAIPAAATNVRVTENSNRVETFVTRGAPTPIAQVNAGLEIAPVTHPNDLVAGEAAQFRLLLDGRPAANIEVTIAPGNARYRNETAEIKITTNAQGAFSVTFPNAGMWWVNASVRDLPSQVQGATRSANYSGVYEVLP